MNNLVEKMRSARNNASVILMRYNQCRSSRMGTLFLAVEGTEDIAFYETMMRRIIGDILPEHHFFVCDGKDNVLALLDILSENVSDQSKNIAYFVDRDFDDLKGFLSHPRLYMTSTYSIENYLARREVLGALLNSEFRCSSDEGSKEADAALSAYDAFIESYKEQFEIINTCIFVSRKSKKYNINTGNSIENYVKTTLKGINFHGSELNGAISILEIPHSQQEIEETISSEKLRISEFKALDPLDRWRGKYLYYVFVKFLKMLAEDRGRRKDRVVFDTRATIHFEPSEGSIRLFSSVAPIPTCLRAFFLSDSIFYGSATTA